jgi:hypothetical protein
MEKLTDVENVTITDVTKCVENNDDGAGDSNDDSDDDDDDDNDTEITNGLETNESVNDSIMNSILSIARIRAVKAIEAATIAEAMLLSYREETVITDDSNVTTVHAAKVAEATEIAVRTASVARKAIAYASNVSKDASSVAESNIITSIVAAITANRECRDANALYMIACNNLTNETTIQNTYNAKQSWSLIADDSICSFHDACIDGNYEALISDTVDAGK